MTNTTYKRYVIGLNNNTEFTTNEKAITEDAKRDGFFGVITNVVDQNSVEIISNYKTLWIVEDAFGEIKGSLRSRPIFHWKDERIIGHLMLCFLSYLCEALMTKALRNKKIVLQSTAINEGVIKSRPLTVVEAMRELREIRAIPVRVRSSTIWVRTDISGNAKKLVDAISLKVPPKLLCVEQEENVVALNPGSSLTARS